MTEESDAVGMYRPVSMTPLEYERSVLRLFSGLAKEGVEDIRLEHQERISGSEGQYTIDGTIRYSFMGAEFLVLLEAKLHRRPVGREAVQVLHAKVQSAGAHKGILASSSGFQRGAVRYAMEHGIGLAQIADGALEYQVRSRDGLPRSAPGTSGFAFFHSYETEKGYGFTRLDGTGYIRDLLPGMELQESTSEKGI